MSLRILPALVLALFLLVCGTSAALASNYVGLILKTTSDRAPIRVENNVNAHRFTHLRKDISLHATGIYGDFYKVNLGNGTDYFIEKQYVQELGLLSPKKYTIKSYKIKEHKDFYTLSLKFNEVPIYQTFESENGLNFNLFDISKSVKARKRDSLGGEIFRVGRVGSIVNFSFLPKQTLVGYGVEKDGNSLVLKIRKMPEIDAAAPLKGLKIVVDAGHGGFEPGACANGIIEKTLNLQIAKKLAAELEAAGATVYMTREKDDFVGLYERVDFARDKDALVLLSIHANSLANPRDWKKKHGSSVFYYNKQSKPLADALQKGLLGATGFRDDGVNYASFALTRPTEMLSVLVETGYVIHPYEAKMLKDSEFQDKIAKGLTVALEGYFKNLNNN